jgi:hypothetical protein
MSEENVEIVRRLFEPTRARGRRSLGNGLETADGSRMRQIAAAKA